MVCRIVPGDDVRLMELAAVAVQELEGAPTYRRRQMKKTIGIRHHLGDVAQELPLYHSVTNIFGIIIQSVYNIFFTFDELLTCSVLPTVRGVPSKSTAARSSDRDPAGGESMSLSITRGCFLGARWSDGVFPRDPGGRFIQLCRF